MKWWHIVASAVFGLTAAMAVEIGRYGMASFSGIVCLLIFTDAICEAIEKGKQP